MTDYGTQISTRDEFKGVTIYERQGQSNPVYTIVFKNPELNAGEFKFGVFVALCLLLTWSIIIAFIYDPNIFKPFNLATLVTLAIIPIGTFILYWLFIKNPKTIERAIVLDAGNDEINVLKNGSVEKKHKYSRLHDLIIDEHPKGAKALIKRQEKGIRQPFTHEKLHCLFGLFGVSGTEKVILVSRFEWPRHDTLYEVQQAMQWANNRGADSEDRDTGKPSISVDEAPSQAGATGIKPPLD